jgi:putative FmdB family regulatory protein
MPIYEYECKACHERFEALVYASTQVTCPACGGKRIEKQFSSFAVGGTAPSAPPGCSMPAPGGG